MRTDTDIFDIGRFGWPPDLLLYADLSATTWLNDPSLWSGGDHRFIGKLIPRGYARYVRLNHPAWKNPGPSVERLTWDQHERRLIPVSWATVAQWSNQDLDEALRFEDLLPPKARPQDPPFDEDPYWHLSPVVLEKLIPVLRRLTTTPEHIWMGFCDTTGEWNANQCGWAEVHDDRTRPDIDERRRLRQQFCQEIARLPRWAPPGWAASGRTYWLASGPIETVYDVARGIYSVTPFLWWPEDHAWCVFREIDFDFSLVATTDDGYERIMRLSGVEAYEAEVW
ncbi:MAG: hypothetical protein C7B44_08840 [Sulfobacillus thermosulfidooxidans]|nr:MAG: hypothetical protein C7B44_08840 [Sulfobacillus thermosulfidooxidans]